MNKQSPWNKLLNSPADLTSLNQTGVLHAVKQIWFHTVFQRDMTGPSAHSQSSFEWPPAEAGTQDKTHWEISQTGHQYLLFPQPACSGWTSPHVLHAFGGIVMQLWAVWGCVCLSWAWVVVCMTVSMCRSFLTDKTAFCRGMKSGTHMIFVWTWQSFPILLPLVHFFPSSGPALETTLSSSWEMFGRYRGSHANWIIWYISEAEPGTVPDLLASFCSDLRFHLSAACSNAFQSVRAAVGQKSFKKESAFPWKLGHYKKAQEEQEAIQCPLCPAVGQEKLLGLAHLS